MSGLVTLEVARRWLRGDSSTMQELADAVPFNPARVDDIALATA